MLEKQTRQSSDLASTSRLLTAIVTIAKDSGDWSMLNEQVLLLSKKHGQLRQAITKMVQVVMGFLDETPSLDMKLSVIETLRTVTEGKVSVCLIVESSMLIYGQIFVEVERARATRILSDIKKQQGDINAAADILCELQVETFGSMSRREKTEFILEQVALCIEKGDWTQAGILSRKISTRYFSRRPPKTKEQLEKEKEEKDKQEKEKKRLEDLAGADTDTRLEDAPAGGDDDVTDLKLRYYEQQILLAKHDGKYLDACRHWRQVLDTEAIENNPEQLQTVSSLYYWVNSRMLTLYRPSSVSFTSSSFHPTTTSNPTYYNVSTVIHVILKYPPTPLSSSSSLFQNSCVGRWLRNNSALTSAVATYSPQRCPRHSRPEAMRRKHTRDGRICASA